MTCCLALAPLQSCLRVSVQFARLSLHLSLSISLLRSLSLSLSLSLFRPLPLSLPLSLSLALYRQPFCTVSSGHQASTLVTAFILIISNASAEPSKLWR